MERFKLMRLQSIWGNRCNSEPYQEWLFLPLNQRAVGSTPTRPTNFFNDFRPLSTVVLAHCYQFATTLSMDRGIQPIDRRLIPHGQPSAIGVDGELYARVAELSLHVRR